MTAEVTSAASIDAAETAEAARSASSRTILPERLVDSISDPSPMATEPVFRDTHLYGGVPQRRSATHNGPSSGLRSQSDGKVDGSSVTRWPVSMALAGRGEVAERSNARLC